MSRPKPEMYWPNELSAFENGCRLDLRARLAIEFIKTPNLFIFIKHEGRPVEMVEAACELSAALIEQFETLGWIKPMPDDDALSGPLRTHIRRSTRAQVFQQVSGQQIMQEEAPKLAVAPGANGMARA